MILAWSTGHGQQVVEVDATGHMGRQRADKNDSEMAGRHPVTVGAPGIRQLSKRVPPAGALGIRDGGA